MTTTVEPAPLGPAPPEPTTHAHRPGAPRWLWVAVAVALAPTMIPFGSLVARVIGSGSEAWSIAFSASTGRLVVNTLVLVVLVTATSGLIGLVTAWLTERTDLPGRRWWRVLVALPLVLPSYVVALTLVSATGDHGLIADRLGIGTPSATGLLGAWLSLTIATYPFVYLPVGAAMRRLNPAHEEAARGLGASPWRSFRTIVLPQLRPSLGVGLLLVSLYSLSDFGAVSLARYDSFTRVVYAQYAGRLDRTPAAVLAVLLVLLALFLVMAERVTRGRAAYHSRPGSRPARVVTLRRSARPWAQVGLGLLALVSLGLPVATLVTWAGGASGTGFPWGAVSGSLAASALAAVLVGALALPVAVLVTRHRSRLTGWVEYTAYAVYAIPHIAVGLAVVFFASRYLGGIYQSLTLLVLVYGSMFFAQALGSTRSAVLQISPSVEEASRSLGAGAIKTMVRIVAPLARRGLVAGSLLVFLMTMKELPATLLLRPTGLDFLAVDIWSAADSLLYSRAAGPALLLLAVSAVPMYLLATREQ